VVRSTQKVLTAVVAGGVLVTSAGVSYADTIYNNLDNTIDAVAETMPLNAGGTNGTTQLYVTPANGDGKNGCNFTGSKTLGLDLRSSDPAVATVSPSSVTFTSCSDSKTLTITPLAGGSTTVSATQTSNDTNGTFSLAEVKFTVNVAAPTITNTAPTVSVAGVTGGASYNKGSVPTATCNITDAEDGNKSIPATLSDITGTYASDGIGSQTASCSYTDGGGLKASSSETYSIVDPSAPVIGYTLNPAAPDGLNGWYKGDVSLTWTVSEPQSPNSLSKTGCTDQLVAADQPATDYTCSASSAGGSADQQTVTIKRDGTAPSVTYTSATGTQGTNGWYTSDVEATFTGTDALSGPASATKTATSTGEGTAVAVLSPAFTDNAGNTAAAGTASNTFKIDSSVPNAPTASLSADSNGAGWHKDDVTVEFASAGDNGPSGVASCTADVPVNTETAGQVVSGTCTDNAGNVSATTRVTIKLDKTGPVISDTVTVAGTAGTNDWYTTDVDVTFTATDNLSGPATATQTVTSSGEGAKVSVSSPAFTDVAGNTTAAGAVTKTYKVDKTAPETPTFNGGPSGSYYFGSDPAAPTCTSTDAVSGLRDCVVTGGGTSVGEHSYTATATDNAGNVTTATLKYTVLAWTLKGFYAPVDMSGVWNTVKGGSTVPLKFEIFKGSTELTDTAAVKAFTQKTVACPGSSATVAEVELVTTGGTSLRYDTTAGQFVQNWQTPKSPGSCYTATMTTQDGSTITANFMLK
jgi:hypothetical protein